MEMLFDDLRLQLDKFDDEVALKVKKLREKNKRMKPEDAKKQVMKTMPPMLYIIDSLDAVSTEAERKRDIHEGSYNLEKQKLLGELFRTEITRIKRARMCFFVISQIRDRIGANIRGVKYTRAGGRSLDFYASIVLFLADLGKVYETIKGIKRPVAIKVKARATKNKITKPFRECIFELRFGYGIDDDYACLDWLKETKRLGYAGFKDYPKSLKGIDLQKLKHDTMRAWYDIEKDFSPIKGKYSRTPDAA
jgi:RecA/RadA recombinase